LARAADAKTRISIYGSATVLRSLADFEKRRPVINSQASADRFLNITNKMRQESTGENEIAKIEDLRAVIFGRRKW
jgi:hypothetical protein